MSTPTGRNMSYCKHSDHVALLHCCVNWLCTQTHTTTFFTFVHLIMISRYRGAIPGRHKKFFFSPERSDHLRVSQGFLFNEYGGRGEGDFAVSLGDHLSLSGAEIKSEYCACVHDVWLNWIKCRMIAELTVRHQIEHELYIIRLLLYLVLKTLPHPKQTFRLSSEFDWTNHVF